MSRAKIPDDIKQLNALVRAGRLFDVQKWIAEGRRIMPPDATRKSPIWIAMEIRFHSMLEVLLKAGVEQNVKNSLLEDAVHHGNFDFITLLVDNGADFHGVDFKNVCNTGNPLLIRFFLDRGIDTVTNQPFARALMKPKRPLLGIYLSYRENIPGLTHQLNLALRYHAREGNLKWVCLLLWAGGDGHLRLPDIGEIAGPEDKSSALEEAVWSESIEIAEKIKIDPHKDDLDKLLFLACLGKSWKMIERLLDLGAAPNKMQHHSRPIENLISQLESAINPLDGFRSDSRMEDILNIVAKFADRGARWLPTDKYGVHGLRKGLYRLDATSIERIIKCFKEHKVCPNEVLKTLIETPKMKMLLAHRHSKLMAFVESDPDGEVGC